MRTHTKLLFILLLAWNECSSLAFTSLSASLSPCLKIKFKNQYNNPPRISTFIYFFSLLLDKENEMHRVEVTCPRMVLSMLKPPTDTTFTIPFTEQDIEAQRSVSLLLKAHA